ncbi:nuclear transport factor 2 family protein [Hymenobacter negativus]|uniref:Nuclear transport factor 2 family protein n=1 Tax=Hymenobacter negativus TaxID=2795026 RepID=A0ABS0Q9W9_9BACT|nr:MULTISPECIES: nuclear transport factor 2 family protein [Bacteria]MBH8559128.1 nuclear transport factor 2 family protein [Hymenobacter negativus]MBH8569874.1 nuclear transport factor 2 family protein [Hymenobacter negativus]MBR7209613.1 nuclear transport factor 2 family protein [Microvirga sp. STS02]
MKTRSLLLAFLLALPLFAFSQVSKPKNMAVIKEIEALERQRFEAQVKKDYAFLEKAFADDLVYTHGSGVQNTKTEYIQSIKDGKSQYGNIEIDALNVRAYNDDKTAVVNGTIRITSPPQPDGSTSVARIKYVVVQIKDKKKGWQVVLWQAQKQAS